MPNKLIWIPKRLVEIGLVNVAANNRQQFVNYCEDTYSMRISAAADDAISSAAKVVMLTGPSASGKTTTANNLAQKLRQKGHKVVVLPLDNFFKNIEEYPKLADGTPDYENVEALDIAMINNCLLQLVNGGKTKIPNFDFPSGKRTQQVTDIDVGDGIIIAEGIHALNPRLTAAVPRGMVYKIYAGLREEYSLNGQRILPTRDVRLARRMVRDIAFRGHSVQKTLDMWPQVCLGEDRNIKVFKTEANLLLDTSFTYEINCLAPFVAQMADKLSEDSEHMQQLLDLCRRFALCAGISEENIPKSSMLREFLG